MPVTEVIHPLDFSYEMTTDSRGRNSYPMRWWAETTDPQASPKTVVTEAKATDQGFANPLPAFWATYSFQGETDPFAYLKGNLRAYKPDPSNKPGRWFIDGTYEPLGPGETASDANTDPLARPVRRRWTSEPYSRIVVKDKDGNPIKNAANSEFTEPPEEEGHRPVLELRWNVADSNAVSAFNFQYQYSVNSASIVAGGTTWPARHAKIDIAESSDLMTEGSTSYFELSTRVVFNYEPWDLSLLNQGFMILSPARGLVRATDEEGRPTPEPVLLDTDGDLLTPIGTAVGNFLDFRTRREVSYASLGI